MGKRATDRAYVVGVAIAPKILQVRVGGVPRRKFVKRELVKNDALTRTCQVISAAFIPGLGIRAFLEWSAGAWMPFLVNQIGHFTHFAV
jgi:hypothetical protein